MSAVDKLKQDQKASIDQLQERINSLQDLLNDKNEQDASKIYELTQLLKDNKDALNKLKDKNFDLEKNKSDAFQESLDLFNQQINDPNTIKRLVPDNLIPDIPKDKSNTITWIIIGGIVFLLIIILFALFMVGKSNPEVPRMRPQFPPRYMPMMQPYHMMQPNPMMQSNPMMQMPGYMMPR